MAPDFDVTANCRDGVGRPGQVVVTVRDGALILRVPAGEAAVFVDAELLEQALAVSRALALGAAQIRQQTEQRQRRGR